MSILTSRQQQVYDFLALFQQRNGYAPTLQEIAAHLGVRGNLGVIRHLTALEKKGYLQRQLRCSRGIVLSGRSKPALSLPLVGSVAAGALTEALADIDEHICVDPSLVRGEGCFALRVKGDSMIEAQIVSGDLAIVRPQATAENGDIVVAMLDGEATLKRFFRDGGAIRLQPENAKLQPIIFHPGDGDIRILGKVTGIIRSLV